ncbi:MAG: prepilin-type N-terminal cleavage/methylation domain-containing protein [Thermodesulfobacteriota bacterium]
MSGFTLLELVVVLLIFSLFFSTVYLGLENTLSGGDLKLAGRMIVNEVARARGDAAAAREERLLRFDLEKDRIYLVAPKRPAKEGVQAQEELQYPPRPLPRGVMLEDLVIGAKEKVQSGEVDLRFFSNGSMDRALVHIRNEENQVLTLALNPLTGQVSLREGYVDERLSK